MKSNAARRGKAFHVRIKLSKPLAQVERCYVLLGQLELELSKLVAGEDTAIGRARADDWHDRATRLLKSVEGRLATAGELAA